MSSQTASRHEVSCCKHGGGVRLSLAAPGQHSSSLGGFSSQVQHPPVCPSHWNSLAAHITSKRNLRAGRFPSRNASRKDGCFNAQSTEGVTKTGCCRHRPSRVGEERELVETCFGTRRLGLSVCWTLSDSIAITSTTRTGHSGCDEAHGSRTTGWRVHQCGWAVDDDDSSSWESRR